MAGGATRARRAIRNRSNMVEDEVVDALTTAVTGDYPPAVAPLLPV